MAAPEAVITGASGAIGNAIAAACAQAGHSLNLVARSEESVAPALRGRSGRVLLADLARDEDVERLCERLRAFERVDLLVHAAGCFHRGTVAMLAPSALDELYRVNVRAPYALTQSLLPALRDSGGQVVFVNSSAGVRPAEEAVGAYAATKYALRALADALRAEENTRGVRVLSVYPGRTAGRLQERLHEVEGTPYDAARLMQPVDVAAATIGALSLPRSAEVTDVHLRPMRKPLV